MATFTVSANALKYASGSTWSGGKARQGVYSGTRYEGAIHFAGLSGLDFSNISVSQIQMRVTFGPAGGASGKNLTFYKSAKDSISGSISSMRGASLGEIAVSNAYNRTVTLNFSSGNHSGLFTALRDYFASGSKILILYVPRTRGTYSGGYCYDYLSVTAMTLTFTFEYLRSNGSMATASVAAGSAARLNITSYNSAYTHKATWKFGAHTATQTIAAGGTYAAYTIPLSWLDAIPNATSGAGSVTLETLNASGASLGTASYGFTVTVPASVTPSISSVTASPVNDNPAIAGWGLYVYGKSKASLKINGAAGAYGSTIKSYSLTTSPNVGSATSGSLNTGLLYAVGTVTVTAKVTDSRGRTASKTASFNVLGYESPYFSSLECYRCNSSGARDDANGAYARIRAVFGCTTLNNKNTASCQLVMTQVGGSYTTSANLTSGTAVILGGGNLAIDATYNVKVTLSDTAGSVSTYGLSVPSAAYIMHIKKGGKAVGFGTAAGADNTVTMGWPLKLKIPLEVSQGGTGTNNAAGACTNLGAVKRSGDTMTGNLSVSGYLYPSIYLLPTYNNTTNQTVFEGSYVGAASFAAWQDATGNNRRMLEVRNAAAESSRDNAVVLRDVINGSYYAFRVFHSGMPTPVPIGNGGTGANNAAAARSNIGANNASNLNAGTVAMARLPFKVAYGSTSINSSKAVTINYSSAGFTAVPKVLVTYNSTGSAWSGDNGAIKVHSKTTTQASVIVGGSFTSNRGIDWLAIGT